MNVAYLSIGSNIGNRFDYLKQSVGMLMSSNDIQVSRVSSVYETDPVGYVDQAAFFNIVVELKTLLAPQSLLETCSEIENELGRMREIRWGPRTVDLDILLYNEENMKTEQLIIPHPRMEERGFVLIPLVELNPDLVLPDSKLSLSELSFIHKEGVHLWKRFDGVDAFMHFES